MYVVAGQYISLKSIGINCHFLFSCRGSGYVSAQFSDVRYNPSKWRDL
nr:MAG TPA: hypothetical protein [Caudoviricetes sp.]